MPPLSKLSLWLIIICLFIPIMILSITRGFQYFSLEKLLTFYQPFFTQVDQPLEKPTIPSSSHLSAYYQDFILLKKDSKESPSLIRAISSSGIDELMKSKNLILLRGKNMAGTGQILISESLAMDLGVDIGGTVKAFVFLPHNSFPIREASFSVSGIISFQNATLDRTISLITPETLENQFFIRKTKVNIFMSSSKKDLKLPFLSNSRILSLDETPSVIQMKQQYFLLLLLALASSCLCFFSLFMNLKTNLKNHLYSIHVFKILGLPESAFIQAFFLQNVLLVVLGIFIGVTLSLSIIPHIGGIVMWTQNILNDLIFFLRSHGKIFQNLNLVEFLPKDVFYIQAIPVKMAFQDFLYLSAFLLGGIIFIQGWYAWILKRRSGLEVLKREQGV